MGSASAAVASGTAALSLSVLRVEQRVGVSASCSCFADTHTAWLVGHHHEGSCRGKHGAAHGVPYRTVHVLLLLMGWAATVWGFPCSGLDFLFFLSRETSVFLTGQACFGLLFISPLAASVAFLAQQSRSLIASQLVISPYLRLRSTFFYRSVGCLRFT